MVIYTNVNKVPESSPEVALTTGTFDGVHIGHQQVLHQLTSSAKTRGLKSMLLTFWPHPRMVLQPDKPLHLLQTVEEKIEKLRAEGLDYLVIQPFTKEFAKTSSVDFIQKIVRNQLKARHLVIGYDHKFGHNREGSFDFLMENGGQFGLTVEEISAEQIKNAIVSSSAIRTHIEEGRVELAKELLTYPYTLSGEVVHGNKIGRTLGYPTANVEITEEYKLIPANGIYAALTTVDGTDYPSMVNIGNRPSIGENLKRTIESYLFNFDQDIYGKNIQVKLDKYIRPEAKVDGLAALQALIDGDNRTVKSFYNL